MRWFDGTAAPAPAMRPAILSVISAALSSSPAETLRRGVSILLADHVYDYGGKIVTVARVTLECIASDGTRFTIDGDSVRPMPATPFTRKEEGPK